MYVKVCQLFLAKENLVGYLESSSTVVCHGVIKELPSAFAKHLLATAYGPRHTKESQAKFFLNVGHVYVNNMASAPVNYCLRIYPPFFFGSHLDEASLA